MARAPYPLEAVESLRALARDTAAQALRAAETRVREAEETLASLHEALGRAQQARLRLASQAPAHADGASLRREAAYAAQLQRELQAASAAVRAGQAALEAAGAERAAAQDRLAQAEAERAVVARDHALHDDTERRRQAQAEERAHDDSPRPRPRPRRPLG